MQQFFSNQLLEIKCRFLLTGAVFLIWFMWLYFYVSRCYVCLCFVMFICSFVLVICLWMQRNFQCSQSSTLFLGKVWPQMNVSHKRFTLLSFSFRSQNTSAFTVYNNIKDSCQCIQYCLSKTSLTLVCCGVCMYA